jgi:fermentation-respiration switch protein FrsA (DUF1100 family)
MKWWLKVIISIVAVAILAFIGISVFLGFSVTRVVRVPVEENPAALGLQYEDISFLSRDDALTLRGWFLPAAGSDKVVIMLHGGEMHRADPSIDMLGIAADLVHHDYNVLMFDFRGHGESEGNRMSAGYHEQKDLLGAIDYVKGRSFEHIGALGFSMGAATALLVAATNNDIDAVVSDSSFADMADMIKSEFAKRTKFPKFFLTPVLFVVKIFFGVDLNAVRPVEAVAKIAPRPILFIHSAGDTFVPLDDAYKLLDAARNPEDELWVAPNADHVQAYLKNKTEYIDRVTSFFGEALK